MGGSTAVRPEFYECPIMMFILLSNRFTSDSQPGLYLLVFCRAITLLKKSRAAAEEYDGELESKEKIELYVKQNGFSIRVVGEPRLELERVPEVFQKGTLTGIGWHQ